MLDFEEGIVCICNYKIHFDQLDFSATFWFCLLGGRFEVSSEFVLKLKLIEIT
jgi:hypothetical protein